MSSKFCISMEVSDCADTALLMSLCTHCFTKVLSELLLLRAERVSTSFPLPCSGLSCGFELQEVACSFLEQAFHARASACCWIFPWITFTDLAPSLSFTHWSLLIIKMPMTRRRARSELTLFKAAQVTVPFFLELDHSFSRTIGRFPLSQSIAYSNTAPKQAAPCWELLLLELYEYVRVQNICDWECCTEEVSECRGSQTNAVSVNVGRVVFGQKGWDFFWSCR